MKTKIKVQKVHFMTVKKKLIKINTILQGLIKTTLHQLYIKIIFLVFLPDKTEKMNETILLAAVKLQNKNCKRLFL